MGSNRFVDSVQKTFDSLWKNKENADAGPLPLASLGRLTKNRIELHDKINIADYGEGQ